MSPSSATSAVCGLEVIERLAVSVQGAVEALLERSALRYEDINAGGGMFVLGWNKWQWQKLPDDAQPLAGAARRAHDALIDFARLAFRAGAPDRGDMVEELSDWLLRLIEQPNGSLPHGAPGSSIEQIVASVGPRIESFLVEVARLPNAHGEEELLIVADTSALLDRPDLQEWRLDGEAWTIVLVPQVLAELDERKRDSRTSDAAQKIIRQLDEFDRRGDTFAGVPLSRRLSVREVPVSPNMDATLPWLDARTPDDVIVAAALELVWGNLRARVALLASDRNVRNKARLAGLGTLATGAL